MKADSPLASKDYLEASDLINIPLINTARIETQNQLKNWMGNDYEKLNFVAVSELSSTAATLVENDVGYAIVIEGSTSNVISDQLCFRPLYPKMTTASLVIWKKYQSFSYTISRFIDFISKEIKDGK